MERETKEIMLVVYDIEQRLFTYSYYVGEARRTAGAPVEQSANMQASTDDHTQLNDHMHIAVAEIIDIANRYFSLCSHECIEDNEHEGYEIFILNVTPPRHYPEKMIGELKKRMESYMVMRTLNQWMLQHKPDEALLTASEAEKLRVQLREVMDCREKPQKRVTRRRKNIEI